MHSLELDVTWALENQWPFTEFLKTHVIKLLTCNDHESFCSAYAVDKATWSYESFILKQQYIQPFEKMYMNFDK